MGPKLTRQRRISEFKRLPDNGMKPLWWKKSDGINQKKETNSFLIWIVVSHMNSCCTQSLQKRIVVGTTIRGNTVIENLDEFEHMNDRMNQNEVIWGFFDRSLFHFELFGMCFVNTRVCWWIMMDKDVDYRWRGWFQKLKANLQK